MGSQISTEYNNRDPETKNYSKLTQISPVVSSKITTGSNKFNREFVIYNGDSAKKAKGGALAGTALAGLILIKLTGTVLYTYYQKIDQTKQKPTLINITNLSLIPNESRVKLIDSLCISTCMNYICLPEIDSDSNYFLTVYSLKDISSKLHRIKSVEVESYDVMTYITGDVFHIISADSIRSTFLSPDENILRINIPDVSRSIQLSPINRESGTLQTGWDLEKIRFSLNGELMLLYGSGVGRIYRISRQADCDKSDNVDEPRIVETTRFIFSQDVELIDCCVTNLGVIYYILKSQTVLHYCISKRGCRAIIFERPYEGDYPKLFLTYDCRNLIMHGLFSADNAFSDMVILGEWGSTASIRVFIEMDNSVMLLGTAQFPIETNSPYSLCSDEYIVLKNGDFVTIYDFKTIIPQFVTYRISAYVRSKVTELINNSIGKITTSSNLTKSDMIKDITIQSLDLREETYQIKSSIVKYFVFVDKILHTDTQKYAMTVNTNMTLLGSKSFSLFEDLLNGCDPTPLIRKLFDYYPNSLYDRYQTVSEFTDHFCDYIKYILLGYNCTESSKTDPNPSQNNEMSQLVSDDLIKLRSRIAIMTGYMLAGVIFAYYGAEINDSNNVSTYQLHSEIIDNFCDNFEPLRSMMVSYKDRFKSF